ncbi:HD-GYP domain-containing protein [Rubrivivax benzoatilyticus]|uniref:HD domain-containing protein n=1 Tax=Rubrivivax benzoatilyticus TaxID=316997 RepID=A0ABX0I3A8_9BURK|nr:HD domain-containing phosphohydrolase [Rubrivivax benzoatilyticus]EGJ09829.1 hypothetical protein RBXJA2T_05848 [Rubrivivax benzoatilyticus JA2 = ATCC BAA-35]NHL00287.1 hypothetical protein [Rubrivivax benzoatilyticus]NHL26118.1 hypothetical protein [Rubrivivax benzoatilyticus]
MSYTALATVAHRIQVGQPLPFNVRNADLTLLLARGHRVATPAQLQALLERGALVDLTELLGDRERLAQLPREQLPSFWRDGLGRVAEVLQATPAPGFRDALDGAAQPVLALIERDPDLAIFQVLRQEGGDRAAYGVRRSVGAAITAYLVARRLHWDAEALERTFKVALTMNLAMLELQGELAEQRTPLTPAQHAALLRHPLRGREMLEQAGITDRHWLQAVERHHEAEDGSGYPTGTTEVGEIASLVRRVDTYTAKLAARGHRGALAADIAGRQMFMQDPGHPMTLALVKEFGIYPPGCFVRLVSGALGVVVGRGPTVATPIVACLIGPGGRALPAPLRVDTAERVHTVSGVVGDHAFGREFTADELMQLALA